MPEMSTPPKESPVILPNPANGSVNTRIWMSQGTDYLFPEKSLVNPPATAICFSGGGTRALTAAMGQLRAMNRIGTLAGAGYISCVSGGSWASVPYTYYQSGPANDDELLGPVIEPGEISVASLHDLPATRLATGASVDFWKQLVHELEGAWNGTVDPHKVWIDAVGKVFMQPFGLYQEGQPPPFFTLNDSTETEIRSRNHGNPFVTGNRFVKAHANRPYLVVNSSLLWPDNFYSARLTSFEYTPLAVGDPYYQKLYDDLGPIDLKNRWVGGGFLEPFAYGCGSPGNALVNKAKGEYRLSLTAPGAPYGLADASGTSSAAYSADAAEVSTAVSPKVYYWPVTSAGNEQRETEGRITYFGDGGSLENMGLVNMLRRGVKAAVVFINTSTVLAPGYTGQGWPDADNPEIDTDFAKLFGYTPQGKAYDNRVFTQADFTRTVGQLQQSRASGGPIVAWNRYRVQPNAWWGIPGGDEVFIVWVYLGRCAKWEAALPAATRSWMNIGNSGPFGDFPNYKTIGQDWHGLHFRLVQLSVPQIVALADLTCWCCQQFLGEPEVRDALTQR